MTDVTRMLEALEAGREQAAAELLPLVYDELRRLAAHKLAHEQPGQTLDATALVHEAYLRLVPAQGDGPAPHWKNRRHFLASAAEAMRRILIDNARRKKSHKHGGAAERRAIEEDMLALPEPREDLLALDEALERLAAKDPLKAELVKMRYFVGLTMPEAAEALSLGLSTVERHWTFARAWLYRELSRTS